MITNDRFDWRQRRWRVTTYMAFAILCYMISSYIQSRNDDLVFREAISTYGSIYGWADFFSQNWGGRIIPQGLVVLLLQLPDRVFTLGNTVAWMTLLYYAKHNLDLEDEIPELLLFGGILVAAFLLISSDILYGAIFWKCANVLYLWGTAGILAAIHPTLCRLHGRRTSTPHVIVAAIAVLYTAGFEQGAAVMCGMLVIMTIVLCWRMHRVDILSMLLSIESVVLTAYFCAWLPGNRVRSAAETIRYMPNYGMYSITDKAIAGLHYTITGLEENAPFLILILMMTATATIVRSRQSKWICYIAVLVSVYFALEVVNHYGVSITGNETALSSVFRLIDVNAIQFVETDTRKTLLHVMMYVLTGGLCTIAVPGDIDLQTFLGYYGGLASMWLMGFSPTIEASGARPQFLGCLLLILVEIRLVSRIRAYHTCRHDTSASV